MSRLMILQGVPGSGKSTFARSVARYFGWKIVSTDDFHYIEGVYRFQPDNLSYFHAWSQWYCDYLLQQGYDVIVDNCNIRRIHARPYFDLAVKYDIRPEVWRFPDVGMHIFPNTHGVPYSTVSRMMAEMEELI